MQILQLTEGTGTHFGGASIRDHALAISLRRLGHKVTFAGLTQRPVVEEEENWTTPVFYDLEHVSLSQYSALYQLLPAALSSLAMWRLENCMRRMSHASGEDRGHLLLSMLAGADGRQAGLEQNLIDWIAETKPDVVSLSSLRHLSIVPRIQDELKIPVVVSLLGQYREYKWLPADLRNQAFAKAGDLLRGASARISPSQYFADLVRDEFGLGKDVEIHVIPSGIALNHYSIRPAPPQRPTIGYLGRLREGHGLEDVIAVFQKLKKDRIPDLELAIAGSMDEGDLDYLSEVMKPVAGHESESAVKLLPNVGLTEKVSYLHGLTVLCVPAKYEAFGMYVVEAMAVGVPVVQPDAYAFGETIRRTGGGLLFPPDRLAAMAECLEKLLKDPHKCEELGSAGRRGVIEHYSSEQMAGEVLQVFEKSCSSM